MAVMTATKIYGAIDVTVWDIRRAAIGDDVTLNVNHLLGDTPASVELVPLSWGSGVLVVADLPVISTIDSTKVTLTQGVTLFHLTAALYRVTVRRLHHGRTY